MSDDQISGISRAIAIAGNQAALSRLIWDKCRTLIWQARISDWERAGGIPTEKQAQIVSLATGVPVADLLRPPVKRQHRRAAARRKGAPTHV